ncbi:hypothetical protein D3C71_1903180 [compost metagenome]
MEGGVAEARAGEERELSAEAKRTDRTGNKEGWLQGRGPAHGRQWRTVLEAKKREAQCLPLGCSSMVLGFLCSLLPWREKGWG